MFTSQITPSSTNVFNVRYTVTRPIPGCSRCTFLYISDGVRCPGLQVTTFSTACRCEVSL